MLLRRQPVCVQVVRNIFRWTIRCMQIVKNGKEPPPLPSGTSYQTYFHGTYADKIPEIIRHGLRPGNGAGSEAIGQYYFNEANLSIPGVYVSKNWKTAARYPIDEKPHKDWPVGRLLA